MRPPSPPTAVTVIVVTWQGAHLLPGCLESLRRQTLPHAVVVVDNGSTDGTEQLLAERFPEVDVVQTGANLGFAGGAQAGLDAARTPYVALLNNDAVASPAGWRPSSAPPTPIRTPRRSPRECCCRTPIPRC